MSVNSNSALSPASLIAAAFKYDDVVATKTTTGIQTMAAAILAHHAEKESRRASIKALSERGEAFDTFKAEIVAAHIQPRMSSKSDAKDDVRAAANTKNASQMVLLNKGFTLAFALDACNVSLASFVAGKDGGGLFHVPVSSLLANDDKPLGSLGRAAESDTRIPLDGRTYAIEHNEKFTNIKAFPARVLEVAGYKKRGAVPGASGANDSAGQGTGKVETPKTQNLGLPQMIKGIAELAAAVDKVLMTAPVMSFAEIDTDMIAAFSDVGAALDSWTNYIEKAKQLDAVTVQQSKAA